MAFTDVNLISILLSTLYTFYPLARPEFSHNCAIIIKLTNSPFLRSVVG